MECSCRKSLFFIVYATGTKQSKKNIENKQSENNGERQDNNTKKRNNFDRVEYEREKSVHIFVFLVCSMHVLCHLNVFMVLFIIRFFLRKRRKT